MPDTGGREFAADRALRALVSGSVTTEGVDERVGRYRKPAVTAFGNSQTGTKMDTGRLWCNVDSAAHVIELLPPSARCYRGSWQRGAALCRRCGHALVHCPCVTRLRHNDRAPARARGVDRGPCRAAGYPVTACAGGCGATDTERAHDDIAPKGSRRQRVPFPQYRPPRAATATDALVDTSSRSRDGLGRARRALGSRRAPNCFRLGRRRVTQGQCTSAGPRRRQRAEPRCQLPL